MTNHGIGLWLGLSLALCSNAQADDQWRFVGDATKLDAGPDSALLYREEHTVSGYCGPSAWVPVTDDVRYLEPGSDTPFATKQVDYTDSVIRPDFDFRQPRFNTRMVVTKQGNSQVTIKYSQGSDNKTFTTSIDPSVVIDAGFDNLVRRHWSAVTRDKTVDFQFLAPTRGEHYAFVLEKASEPRVKADITLRIKPTGMLTRFLVDPITLGYSNQGELTDYYGLTNIMNGADSNYLAHIRYRTLQKPGCPLIP